MSIAIASSERLNSKHYLLLFIAFLGWVFDIMDMFLLVLVKDSVFKELLGPAASPADIAYYGSWSLALTLIGWSLGGLIFGVVADKWGRTRTMALTIVAYSVFTGLCGLTTSAPAFLILRFCAALGIGGEWATGASLIAEMFPKTSRAWGAGILQSASSFGFYAAILLNFAVGGNWRYAFMCGAIPAFIALLVRMGLREPEAWVKSHAAHEKSGSVVELFSDPVLRRRVLAATGLAFFGIAAYWSTNFLAPTALVIVINADAELKKNFLNYKTIGLLTMTTGNLVGFISFVPLAEGAGRKIAFIVFHVLSLISMPVAFLFAHDYTTWLWLFFIAGACTSGIYTGYTIMFPELFPTRVRATGAGFCYNVSRIVAACGPMALTALQVSLVSGYALDQPRAVAVAGALMAGLYFFAVLFVPLLPETKGVEAQ